MGFHSLSIVLRVSEERLRRMIDAAARLDYSCSRHSIWVEHIMGDRMEALDITDQLCHDYEEFPEWLRADSHFIDSLELRENRLLLHHSEHAYRRCRRDANTAAAATASWQRFQCCPIAQRPLEPTGWLCSSPKLPTGLLKFAHAADLLALSGAARLLHFLSHDLVRSEELAFRMRKSNFECEVRLEDRAKERRRTLLHGRVDTPSTVSVKYTDREVLAEDARGIVQTGVDFLCGSMRFAESCGAQKGWHIVRVWAYGAPAHLSGTLDAIVRKEGLDQKATIDGLTASEFWVEEGDEQAKRLAGLSRMQVNIVFQKEKDRSWRRDDTCVEDSSRKNEMEDAINTRIPKHHRIPGGTPQAQDPTCWCEFYVLPSAEVPAFSQQLEAELSAGVESQHVVEHLARVVHRAAEKGQALFIQGSCG